MLSFSALRHRIRRCLLSSATTFSLSTSASSSTITPPTDPHPSRKGRQSLRRILHLLYTNSGHSQTHTLSQTLSHLETSPHSLSSSQASNLISAIGNPIISFYFYQFLNSLPTFKPNLALFNSLITSQLNSISPNLRTIQFYFKESKKHNVHFSTHDFCGFFDLVVLKYIEIAEFLIRVFLDDEEFDESGYDYAISAYAKHGFCEKAIFVAERVRARCESPSLGFYSSMMEVYRKNGDSRSAVELYLEMQDGGIVANEDVYRILLEILAGAGWVKLSWIVLQDLVKAGFKIDSSLGLHLVRKFLDLNMLSEAEYLFRERVIKDKESLSVLAEAMAEQGKPLVGYEIIESMCGSGFDVDGCVYACLIRGFGKIGLVSEAEKIFSKTKVCTGISNMHIVYISMVYVYCRAGMKKMAEMVWCELESTKGYRITEEACIYMMSMYGELCLIEHVLRLFDQFKKSSHCVSIDLYVTLIDALSKSGKLTQARNFLLEMKSSGISPNNIIYSLMMEAYLRVDLVNHAVALVDEHKRSGLEIDDAVSTSVIKVWIKAGNFLELERFLDKLTKLGIKIPRDKGAHLVQICGNDICLRKLSRLVE